MNTYLTATELSKKIKYDPRTIRNVLKDSVFIEGEHYIRPFGGRKLLFIWERIERTMTDHSLQAEYGIPLASGGVCRG
jgi:hypothetical protein